MSLALAIPLGVASAIVYGASIVVQHRASHRGDQAEDARRLLALLRDPRWLFAIGGDGVGFLLNIGALAAGPVVVIQPLVVLMLPVALIVGWLTGGARPGRGDVLGCVGVVGGLAAFLVLIGNPGGGHVPHAHRMAIMIIAVLLLGAALSLAVLRRGATLRGAMYGVAAGLYFGALGVLVDASSEVVARHGWRALVTTGRGLTPLIGILLLGLGGIVLTQVSFQVGKLAATLPANTAADPFSAVVIGAVLLHEHLPLSTGHVIAYALCLAAVIAGAVRLAAPAVAGS